MTEMVLKVDYTNTSPHNPKFSTGSIRCDGEWYTVNKPVAIETFVVGETYKVMVESRDYKGKTYYNVTKKLSATDEAPTPAPAPTTPAPARKAVDWDAKDRSQLIGGLSHDAPELVKVIIETGKPLQEVLDIYHMVMDKLIEMRKDFK